MALGEHPCNQRGNPRTAGRSRHRPTDAPGPLRTPLIRAPFAAHWGRHRAGHVSGLEQPGGRPITACSRPGMSAAGRSRTGRASEAEIPFG
jgi:hypothetical protein